MANDQKRQYELIASTIEIRGLMTYYALVNLLPRVRDMGCLYALSLSLTPEQCPDSERRKSCFLLSFLVCGHGLVDTFEEDSDVVGQTNWSATVHRIVPSDSVSIYIDREN